MKTVPDRIKKGIRPDHLPTRETTCPHCKAVIYVGFVIHNGCCPTCSKPLAIQNGVAVATFAKPALAAVTTG
jgi:hypothetical protein